MSQVSHLHHSGHRMDQMNVIYTVLRRTLSYSTPWDDDISRAERVPNGSWWHVWPGPTWLLFHRMYITQPVSTVSLLAVVVHLFPFQLMSGHPRNNHGQPIQLTATYGASASAMSWSRTSWNPWCPKLSSGIRTRTHRLSFLDITLTTAASDCRERRPRTSGIYLVSKS